MWPLCGDEYLEVLWQLHVDRTAEALDERQQLLDRARVLFELLLKGRVRLVRDGRRRLRDRGRRVLRVLLGLERGRLRLELGHLRF